MTRKWWQWLFNLDKPVEGAQWERDQIEALKHARRNCGDEQLARYFEGRIRHFEQQLRK